MMEVQDSVDGAMAPLEDMDFSDDERLEDLDDIDEETDIKEEFHKEEKCPVSHLPSTTNGHAQPATILSGSKNRDDFLTARQLRIALYALCDGLHQASRVFSTDTQLIRSWLKEARKRSRQTGQEQKVHVDGRDRMVAWVLSMREQQLPITESNLFHKASTLKKKGAFSDSFRISYDWAVSFMLQHRLGVRSIGREAMLARSLPLSLEAKIKSFREFTQKVIQVNKLSESTVAAMDELCLFVDLRLVQDKSRCSEALELTGSLPLVTVYLTVLANGIMLPSLVLANRQLAEKALPEFIQLEAGPDSLTVEEALDLWTNKVWLQNVSSSTQPSKSMLVLDRHREHLGDSFLTSISGSGTLPGMIPGGCSFRLQPLEVCLKPILQRFLLSRWAKFTAGNPKELEEISPQRLQANVAQLLVDWVVEALTHMNTLAELWKKSFHLTGLLPGQQQEDPEVEKKEGEKMTSPKPEEIQSDLINTLTETLLGPEALEVNPPELLELEDEEDTVEDQEQGEGEERQEDKDTEEEKGVNEVREETGKETREDRKEIEEEGKETKEGGRLKEEKKEGQHMIEGVEDRKAAERDGKETEEDRIEEIKKPEEDTREKEKETEEDREEEIKKLEEDSKEKGKETEEDREEEIKKIEVDNKEEGKETEDDREEEIKKLEEDSEEEGKETEEDRMEVSKERRETRIVIGEEVGDEWKITVKSRTEGVEADGDEDDRMDES